SAPDHHDGQRQLLSVPDTMSFHSTKKSPGLASALVAVLTLGLTLPLFGATVHVAPDGRDTGDGSAAKPFATLARAQTAMRQLKPGADGPVTVELAAGTYHLAAPLVLSP